MLIVFPILALLCAPAMWWILGRPHYFDQEWTKAKRTPPPDSADISVIIPARNEAHNLPALLKSIQSQSVPPREILVIDDQSEDDTAAIASQHQAKVISGKKLPEGWKGKTWACQQGAEASQAPTLLFLDADTRLEPSFLEYLLSIHQARPGVVSIAPHHHTNRPYEELSAFFNLLMLAGVNAFGANRPTDEASALFGQCLLVDRRDYQRMGGHEAVKSEILENFQLAKQCQKHQVPTHCLLGRGGIRMRMFPNGLDELCQSWRKGFTTGAAGTAPRILLLSSLWISGAMFVIVSLLISLLLTISSTLSLPFYLLTATAYLTYAIQCAYAFRLAGNFSIFNALFFPISLIFYQYLFFSALLARRRKQSILWKGRPTS